MIDLQQFFLQQQPYRMAQKEKERWMTAALLELTEHHRAHCAPYANILSGLGFSGKAETPADIPFLTTSVFKSVPLSSVAENEVKKTLTSSGTSGQKVSRITLDAETAALQQEALGWICRCWCSTARLFSRTARCSRRGERAF